MVDLNIDFLLCIITFIKTQTKGMLLIDFNLTVFDCVLL
jgi:hypothetical protein